MEAHLAVNQRDPAEVDRLKGRVKDLLRERHGISHVMLELESARTADHDREVIRQE